MPGLRGFELHARRRHRLCRFFDGLLASLSCHWPSAPRICHHGRGVAFSPTRRRATELPRCRDEEGLLPRALEARLAYGACGVCLGLRGLYPFEQRRDRGASPHRGNRLVRAACACLAVRAPGRRRHPLAGPMHAPPRRGLARPHSPRPAGGRSRRLVPRQVFLRGLRPVRPRHARQRLLPPRHPEPSRFRERPRRERGRHVRGHHIAPPNAGIRGVRRGGDDVGRLRRRACRSRRLRAVVALRARGHL